MARTMMASTYKARNMAQANFTMFQETIMMVFGKMANKMDVEFCMIRIKMN